MRTANTWTITNSNILSRIINERGLEQVADDLDVSIDTVRAWRSGARAPNRRFQLAIRAFNTDFRNLSASAIGGLLSDFLEVNRQDVAFLSERLGVSERTVQRYLNGESLPRSLNRIRDLLRTPTPA